MGLASASYRRESIGPDAELGENRLPGCPRVANRLKRWLLGTHQEAVHPKQLDHQSINPPIPARAGERKLDWDASNRSLLGI